MENIKNVQLHDIIKNSLATYLSYKWSADKLYLKRRKKKDQKKRKTNSLERPRSIINLENNVFIYDATKKTFTQLDLCDCFKNGLKYRGSDPFSTKSMKKKYEICELDQNSPTDLQEYRSYQLVNVKDSVEHIFSNQMVKRGSWTRAISNLCPSKFDLFIQKELNKCTGKNFDVKSFKINTKQETSSSSNDKVCSSAAIGYYTITTYDDALQCQESPMSIKKGRKLSTKQCNFIGIRKETLCPKKMYSKGLQCKLSNQFHKKEKVSPSKDLGVQCFFVPVPRGKYESKKEFPEQTFIKCSSNKFAPVPRQRILLSKRMMKNTRGSLSDIFPPVESRNIGNILHINSSAEIKRMLNAQSDSSLTLSNTGEFFSAYGGPRPLLAYYQTSSSSKDKGGDTNNDHYMKNEAVLTMMKASNNEHISKTSKINYASKGTMKETSSKTPKNDQGVSGDAVVAAAQPDQASPVCSIYCKKNEIVQAPVCDCTYEETKHKQQKQTSQMEYNIRKVCSSKCTGPCAVARKSTATLTCPNDCPCPGQKLAERRDTAQSCVCPPPPRKKCCDCNAQDEVTSACICDLLCSLRERIRKQTEEQNRNLDQILEELDKQDKEIQYIRHFVEKNNKKKYKPPKCCGKKNAVCSCYTTTVEYDFNSPVAVTKKVEGRENVLEDSLEDVFGEMKTTEPELIQLFGSERKTETKKQISRKDSWKALWRKNSRIMNPNDFFKKKSNNVEKNSTTELFQSKTAKKEKKEFKWFSKLVNSTKELKKTAS